MNRRTVKIHIITAVILVTVQTAGCFFAYDFDAPIIFMLITNIAYAAWISSGERGYAPWLSCFGFTAAQAVQFMLNKTGVVPSHNGMICLGLGQFCYCVGLLLTAVLFVIANFFRWVRYLGR